MIKKKKKYWAQTLWMNKKSKTNVGNPEAPLPLGFIFPAAFLRRQQSPEASWEYYGFHPLPSFSLNQCKTQQIFFICPFSSGD